MFLILKLFFFSDFLNSKLDVREEKFEYVSNGPISKQIK